MTEGPAYEGEPGLSLTRSVVGVNPARRLVVLSALRWVPAGLVIPVLVLMLGARGLSLAQTGQMMALYSVVTLSLELPTGGLADAWGRRPVIVASAVLQALSLLLLGVLGSVPFIMLAMVLEALNIPVAYIGLIVAVDRLFDMGRTCLNVGGDIAGSAIVAKSEGELELAKWQ